MGDMHMNVNRTADRERRKERGCECGGRQRLRQRWASATAPASAGVGGVHSITEGVQNRYIGTSGEERGTNLDADHAWRRDLRAAALYEMWNVNVNVGGHEPDRKLGWRPGLRLRTMMRMMRMMMHGTMMLWMSDKSMCKNKRR